MSSQALQTTLGPRSRRGESAAAACTIILPHGQLSLPVSGFTLEGFRAWFKSDDVPENTPVTFFDKRIIIDMSGEDILSHVVVRTAVCGVLYPLVVADDLGIFAMGGALVTNVSANVSNIPDAALATYASLKAERVRLVRDQKNPERCLELEGTPDWVLEIISTSSVQKDTRWLRQAYHRAGIPEYWLIDARGHKLHFHILLHRSGGYEPAPRRGTWQRSAVFGRRFRLERRRDQLGLWQYLLHVQPSR